MTAAEAKKRELDLEKLRLLSGGHTGPGDGFCVMEAVAFVAGEPWSDNPKCSSPIIGAFLRTWNDALDDEGRQKLKPYIPKLVNTRASKEVEDRRGWLCVDWLVRHYTPAWLELAGLKDQATALRDIAELHDLKTVESANPTISAAAKKASAAESAAEKALAPTKVSLQQSAFELLDRMLALGAG